MMKEQESNTENPEETKSNPEAKQHAVKLEEGRLHAFQNRPPPLGPMRPSDYGMSHLKRSPFPHNMGGVDSRLPAFAELPKVYVCGFLFDSRFDFVALVKKAKPEWQRGMLNGIGGLVEPMDRDANEAMEREFHEETQLVFTKWVPFLILHVPEIEVQFFTGHADRRYTLVGSEEEPVGWYQTNATYRPNTLPNLQWLIPMAMLKLQRPDWNEQSILITQ